MKKEYLSHLIKNSWKLITLNKNDILFNSDSLDLNLYYIEDWLIHLSLNWVNIFEIWKWQIIWEKSFLEKTPKSVDAKVFSDCKLYVLTPDYLDSLDIDQLRSFLSSLTLYLSDRIYKINNILSYLDYFNKNILRLSNNFDKELFKSMFNKIINLEWYIVLKYTNDVLIQLSWDLPYNDDIEKLAFESISHKLSTKIWQNYIYLYSWNYVYIMFWAPKLDAYVLSNLLIYSWSIFIYLWELIESNKNSWFIKSYNIQ